MIRIVKARTPPPWEKELFQSEAIRYTPPHLLFAARSSSIGFLFSLDNDAVPSAFVYLSRYLNKKNQRVCRLERLGFYRSNRNTQLEIIREIPKIATNIFGPQDVFEAEIFSEVKSPIFFPSTLYILGSCNREEILNLYQETNFKIVQTTHCYEVDLGHYENNDKEDSKIELRPISEYEWPNYWTLWGGTEYCVDTSYIFKSRANIKFSDYLSYPPDPPYTVLLKNRNYILGFIHWAANIYGLPSLDEKSLAGYTPNLDEAKIFKICMRTDIQTNLYDDILQSVFMILKAKGIKKLQIGNFRKDHSLSSHLQSGFGCKPVHTIVTLHKSNVSLTRRIVSGLHR